MSETTGVTTSERKPFTRASFLATQILNGLDARDIEARTGIAPSTLAVFTSQESTKSADMLMSPTSFGQLSRCLGISFDASKGPNLTSERILHWVYDERFKGQWMRSLESIRKVFSNKVQIAVLRKPSSILDRLFRRGRCTTMIWVSDAEFKTKVVISNVPHRLTSKAVDIFAPTAERTVELRADEFDLRLSLIKHGALRLSEFASIIGDRAAVYTWRDVQNAARENDFSSDDVLVLIAKGAQAAGSLETAFAAGTAPTLAVVSSTSSEDGELRRAYG